MISAGSVGTFCSKITLPPSPPTHTDVFFTDTSRPAKGAVSSLLPGCSRSSRPRSTHRHRRGCELIVNALSRSRRDTPSAGIGIVFCDIADLEKGLKRCRGIPWGYLEPSRYFVPEHYLFDFTYIRIVGDA